MYLGVTKLSYNYHNRRDDIIEDKESNGEGSCRKIAPGKYECVIQSNLINRARSNSTMEVGFKILCNFLNIDRGVQRG